MNIPTIYFIPGTGADWRLFNVLKRDGMKFKVLEFIPHRPKEKLKEYAMRLAEGIDTSKPYIIGGVSFGGMLAMEIARVMKPELTIMISSVARSSEFPFYLKVFRFIPFQRWFSGSTLKALTPQGKLPKDEEIQTWANDLRREADPKLIKWTVNACITWRNEYVPEKLLRIHGTRDPLFPTFLLKGDYHKIKGGNHMMVMGRAAEIHQLIQSELSRLGFEPAKASV